jgi:ABC-type transport system involved in cytochrome c biogenesis permease component
LLLSLLLVILRRRRRRTTMMMLTMAPVAPSTVGVQTPLHAITVARRRRQLLVHAAVVADLRSPV